MMSMDDADLTTDKFKEECGVFGVFGHPDAAKLTALGLHALQHRGQEAAGILSYDGEHFHAERRLGLVGDHFSRESVINRLPGNMAIGHNRYSTTGEGALRNVQPFFADLSIGGIAVAHNGNLTNAAALRKSLVEKGSIFHSTSDTESIVHLVATSSFTSVNDRIVEALHQIEGAYSLLALTKKKLVGARDPLGVRPLVLGMYDGCYVLASETCALDIIGAKFVRDVEPGEMVVINEDGIQSIHPFPKQPSRFCVFEYVYFARPDSMVEGYSVTKARQLIGRELAKEVPADADVIVPVPDSGVPAALGFAQETGIPFEFGIIRSHYVGRTFIQPTDTTRQAGVRMKHNANKAVLNGKRIVLVDDSIVRGTTSMKIVQMVREAGAKEVHMRIASPPTTDCCYYGVNTPERSKLLAATHSVDEMAKIIGVDSLGFVSLDGLYRAVGEQSRNNDQPQYCDGCFSGQYPTALTDISGGDDRQQLSLLSEKYNAAE